MLLHSLLSIHLHRIYVSFFFNDTATTEIYTLSLHDALPIYADVRIHEHLYAGAFQVGIAAQLLDGNRSDDAVARSEEHTSELQSRLHLVCRLLLEKKKIKHSI